MYNFPSEVLLAFFPLCDCACFFVAVAVVVVVVFGWLV